MFRPGRSRCALVALFLVAALFPTGWSLCVAPDGHACWEPLRPVAGGSCADESGAPDECGARAPGSCTDVGLSLSWLRGTGPEDLAPPAPATLPASAPAVSSACAAPADHVTPARAHPPVVLRATTVLRC
jgi:hypothetical protein